MKADGKGNNQNKGRKDDKTDSDKKRLATVHCYNCGMRDHVSARCPTKKQGVKCFKCNERGHIASNCSKKPETLKSNCLITRSATQKYIKDISINGCRMKALIDSGSDLTLICVDKYKELGLPKMQSGGIHFRGIGSDHVTLGEFQAEIVVDGRSYPARIQVVPDTLINHQMLIETDFLDTVEINIRGGHISVNPLPKSIAESDVESPVPEIFYINVTDDTERDADQTNNFCSNTEQRVALRNLIENYKPSKTYESDIKMKLILKDEEPVYQSARRLSQSEKQAVNALIGKWIAGGVVQPSTSDYASPVVLVRKRDGSIRLCVDYRLLNRKVIKDRYPLPLIEDQLDLLQGAQVFSTLDLKNGFFHVKMDESSRKYTAFVVPDGHYEFLRVPFDLCNSPAVFQRYVNSVFRDLMRKRIVMAYMDDLIIPSDNIKDGMAKLEEVLERRARLDWL